VRAKAFFCQHDYLALWVGGISLIRNLARSPGTLPPCASVTLQFVAGLALADGAYGV